MIFISYSHANSKIVKKCVNDLVVCGFDCWYDKEEVKCEADFIKWAIPAIKKSKVFIFFLTNESQKEGCYARNEVFFASEKKHEHIIFVRINDDRKTDEFEFKFPNVSIKDWRNKEDKKKLFRELKALVGVNPDVKYEQGEDYYGGKNGVAQDYKIAAKFYLEAARQGHVGAQHSLGWMYESGKGVCQDDSKAIYWYKKAAMKGYARAQRSLGWMYEERMHNFREAAKWYRMSAAQGFIRAQYSLGNLYKQSRIKGTNSNNKALLWLKESAENGYAQAQYTLGKMYEEGEGVEKNKSKATSWYIKAAEQNHKQALEVLGFSASQLSDEVFTRIKGKSYKANDIIKKDDLAYCQVKHYGFDGKTHIGEFIVNRVIADKLLRVFLKLYEIKYPIEKIKLIDDYEANDEASMRDNNSSAFCFRTIAGKEKLSQHALGLAIDINPLYNPCITYENSKIQKIEPREGEKYIEREPKDTRRITKDSPIYKIFKEADFVWGGEWQNPKDYQHFEYKADNN